jgi:3-methyladenine DNA glycosylase AlkC
MATRGRGAARRSAVSLAWKAELDAGRAETRTLMEALVMDFGVLLEAVLGAHTANAASVASLREGGIVARMEAGGAALAATGDRRLLARAAQHSSDTVRGWAAYALIRDPAADLASAVARLQPFADDAHFGVREWAWMALRPRLLDDPRPALTLLRPWADDPSPRIRRCASEATRPRGVWCKQIPALVAEPSLADELLTALCADPERYVQLSVGNWLNDAGKSQPDWLDTLAARWRHQSDSPHTATILARGLRRRGA